MAEETALDFPLCRGGSQWMDAPQGVARLLKWAMPPPRSTQFRACRNRSLVALSEYSAGLGPAHHPGRSARELGMPGGIYPLHLPDGRRFIGASGPDDSGRP